MKVSLEVWTQVNPTEDAEKVKQAVLNIFPGLELEIAKGRLKGRGGLEELRNFHYLLRRQKILDTARSEFQAGRLGDKIRFILHKQVAAVGKVSFAPAPDAEPLGSIHVTLTSDSPDTLIDWLSPQTRDGVPIKEIEL